MDTKRIGVICYWNNPRSFGFIETHDKTTGLIERFFLHRTKVVRLFADEIVKGCRVRFNISPDFKPSRSKDLLHACDVDIFWPTEQSQAAPTSKEARQ